MNHEPSQLDPLWWFGYAECRTSDLKFVGASGGHKRQKATCLTCPAMETCFWWAVQGEIEEGLYWDIYGGYSGNERQDYVARYHVDHAYALSQYYRERTLLWERLQHEVDA